MKVKWRSGPWRDFRGCVAESMLPVPVRPDWGKGFSDGKFADHLWKCLAEEQRVGARVLVVCSGRAGQQPPLHFRIHPTHAPEKGNDLHDRRATPGSVVQEMVSLRQATSIAPCQFLRGVRMLIVFARHASMKASVSHT